MKLQYDEPLSNFAFNFNLRCYNPEEAGRDTAAGGAAVGAGGRAAGAPRVVSADVTAAGAPAPGSTAAAGVALYRFAAAPATATAAAAMPQRQGRAAPKNPVSEAPLSSHAVLYKSAAEAGAYTRPLFSST